jgi:hypothetical protein
MGKDGRTIGIWINEDEEDLVDNFDEAFNDGTSTYSRSESLKDLMELGIAIKKVQGQIGYQHLQGRQLKHWVQQCMRDQARREALEDE